MTENSGAGRLSIVVDLTNLDFLSTADLKLIALDRKLRLNRPLTKHWQTFADDSGTTTPGDLRIGQPVRRRRHENYKSACEHRTDSADC
jgi:hypothetical protein